jgi:HAE1 family hydrophobic/amphiphilic exporter-1
VNLSKFFINRPVFTILLSFSFFLFGLFSYNKLPVSVLPDVDFPVIQVTATLPGADPETMASTVALPLEKQFSNISGLNNMNSISSLGVTTITLQFDLERDIDGAALDVQSSISSSMRSLPTNLPTPPTFKKINPAMVPILYIALTSDTVKLSDIDYYAQNILAEKFSSVMGVAQVDVLGSQKYALRIQLDPNSMSAYNISIDDVKKSIMNNNQNLSNGAIYGKEHFAVIKAPGQLFDADDYKDSIIEYRNNSPLYLKNIGRAIDDIENNKVATWNNGKRVIVLAIQRQPNSNSLQVINDVKDQLPHLRAQVPQGIDIRVVSDSSIAILESVNDVKLTLILGLILVMLVIFIFLQNFKSTLIPSIVMPLSLIGTFAVMYYYHFSINNISLLAMTLCIGFIIDDAIVILENIIRHLEMGKSKYEASLIGTKEIVFTIISMSVSLIAIFIPLLFMGGVVGRLFHEFSVTICAAIIISAIISLSLSPVLCSLYIELHDKSSQSKFDRFFMNLTNWYKKTLKISLGHKKISLFLFVFTIFASVFLFKIINKGFIPDSDSGKIFGSTETLQNVSFEEMIRQQHKIDEVFLKNPYFQDYFSIIGISPTNPSINIGTIYGVLKSKEERPSSFEIIKDLREQLKQVPGMNVYIQNIANITVGGLRSKSLYQYTMQSTNQDELYNFTNKLLERLAITKGLVDVSSDMQLAQPQIILDIDRAKAAELGVTILDIQNALYLAYGEGQISTIYTPTSQYKVIMELLPEFQADPNSLHLLHIKSNKNNLVPLSSLVTISKKVGPVTVAHFGQIPATTISFNLEPDFSLGQAVQIIEKVSKDISMPDSIIADFQGTAKAFKDSAASLGLLLFMAILVVYIVLGMLYESFIHPLTILAGIPSATFGAILSLYIFGKDLDLYGFVGLIMLIGIIKKNAIMIIDFSLTAIREKKLSPEEAIFEASIIRFRPIMMTSLATIMGALPIALAIGGSGAERSSLGVAIIGGLIISQIVTLYLTPVVFLYLDKLRSHYTIVN